MRLRAFMTLLASITLLPGAAAEEPRTSVAASSGVWETSVAISPANPNNAVAIGVVGGGGVVQSYYTLDGGTSWTASGPFGLSTAKRTYARHGDPVVAAGRDGTMYAVTLIGWPKSYPLTYGGIAVYRSTDAGATWQGPYGVVERAPEDTPRYADDKEWIGVDASGGPHDGNVYVSWLRNEVVNTQKVDAVFARSTDGGVTWGPELSLGRGSGAQISIGPNGEVHLLRIRDGSNISQTSYDGGLTFTDPVIISNSGTFLSDAVDRSPGAHRGNVYITWIGSISGPQLSRSYVGTLYFARSIDGGKSWQPPVAITPVGASTALFQTVACDPVTGHVLITWLDRRANPGGKNFRLHMTRSTDGGATFTPHEALPTMLDMTNETPSGFIGDYNQTTGYGGVFLTSYSNGAGKLFVTRIVSDEEPVSGKRRRSVGH